MRRQIEENPLHQCRPDTSPAPPFNYRIFAYLALNCPPGPPEQSPDDALEAGRRMAHAIVRKRGCGGARGAAVAVVDRNGQRVREMWVDTRN